MLKLNLTTTHINSYSVEQGRIWAEINMRILWENRVNCISEHLCKVKKSRSYHLDKTLLIVLWQMMSLWESDVPSLGFIFYNEQVQCEKAIGLWARM